MRVCVSACLCGDEFFHVVIATVDIAIVCAVVGGVVALLAAVSVPLFEEGGVTRRKKSSPWPCLSLSVVCGRSSLLLATHLCRGSLLVSVRCGVHSSWKPIRHTDMGCWDFPRLAGCVSGSLHSTPLKAQR